MDPSSRNPEKQSRPVSGGALSSTAHDREPLDPNPGEDHLFNVENNPFGFTPGHLSKLIPKSLAAFRALGGLRGLERGLRTDGRSGLSVDEGHLDGAISFTQATTPEPESPVQHEPSSPDVSSSVGRSATDASKSTRLATIPSHLLGAGNLKAVDHYVDRKRVFGEHRLPERKSKTFLQLAWIALQDRVLILLSIAAVVSLALGLYQTFGATHHDTEGEGARIEWIEGVAIVAAILIVVIVGALNDWQKERQFQKLNRKKDDRLVKVIRSGKPTSISIYDVLVGDVMMLEQGDVIPVDGVLVEGHAVSCDEASATGESDLVKKTPADAVWRALHEKDANTAKLDPFLLSGTKVLDGVGTFLVTAVGPHSSHGRTMLSLRDDPGMTPLQAKLNILAGKC